MKVLIANRGEIACRVIRTCRARGIRTVAVYSDVDGEALHTRMADEAIHIGPAPSRDSYLDIQKLVAAAKSTGADAIHPGYGFLSESAEFAEACLAAGLIFVGPAPKAIRAMGLKDAAKQLAEQSGVPVLPTFYGAGKSDAELLAGAARIGWPVLIKAVAGGGGRGMRVATAEADFAAAVQSARNEAMSSFGNDVLLVEKFLPSSRHIEVQVFGDTHGNLVHLGTRDCSLQRRHQKVVEEAPALGLPQALSERMCEAALRVARSVAYYGAGTVEFIVDTHPGAGAGQFYFMEMNTRLQVEHPVTEMITGLDLVDWQLRVAGGERLPLNQAEITFTGHAIEVRICAENPAKNFFPSPGTVRTIVVPELGTNVRVDTGVQDGSVISPWYDSLIAKLVVMADNRPAACALLEEALSNARVEGLRTNLDFLTAIARHPDFNAGHINTDFINVHKQALLLAPQPNTETQT